KRALTEVGGANALALRMPFFRNSLLPQHNRKPSPRVRNRKPSPRVRRHLASSLVDDATDGMIRNYIRGRSRTPAAGKRCSFSRRTSSARRSPADYLFLSKKPSYLRLFIYYHNRRTVHAPPASGHGFSVALR